MTLDELAARELIRDLVAAYAELADRGRFADVAALFTEDGVLEVAGGGTHRGREAIHGFLAGAGAGLRATTGRPLVRHHVSNLRITLGAGAEATGACSFLVLTERGLDHWGRYRDAYVRDRDRWLFRHRRVRVDGWTPASWAAARRGEPPG
ncbi:MAG TPA: nuclear transport factor 2 family protein [Candidatus Binatia bacterium]|nr:nuclear transport factor 2 family protein [Candidatus Binatia bacterium]